MKKIWILALIIGFSSLLPVQQTAAQIPILEIVKAGVKKVIRAVDLQIQRLQNKTVWLQNAQKVLENKMAALQLTAISDWAAKQKELYGKYFDELWKVKTAIRNYHGVKEIVQNQLDLVKEYSAAFKQFKLSNHFTKEELVIMQQVYQGMLEESLKNTNRISLVINAYATQMSDAKRIEIIEQTATNMEQCLMDLRQFNQQNTKISLQRAKDQNDIDVVRKLYGAK